MKIRDLHRTRDVDDTLSILARDGVLVLDWDTPAARNNLIAAILILATPEQGAALSKDLDVPAEILMKPVDAEAFNKKIKKLTQPVENPIRLDVNHVNPFITATVQAIETLARVSVKRKDLFLKRDYRMFGDVSAMMGLSGTASGSVVLSFPMNAAATIVGRMIKRDVTDPGQTIVSDGVGELVNVIAGNAKAAFADTPYHFEIGLPSVVTGEGHMIKHRAGTPCVVVVFDVSGTEVALQVCLAPGEME